MSDLLLMASLGLPRNGLVGLWDPYRDVYGRNCLPTTTGVDTFASTWILEYATRSTSGVPAIPSGYASGGILFAEDGTNHSHDSYISITLASASQATFSLLAHAKERTKIFLGAINPSKTARFNLATGAVIDVTSGATATITDVGGGWYRCSITTAPSGNLFFIFGLLDADGNNIYLGDGTSGAYFTSPHLTLSSGVMPYSAPAGAAGTLQTSLDYSGNGNHLTLGATTGASTDDPAFTGTAWSFDGGDFLQGAFSINLQADFTVLAVGDLSASNPAANQYWISFDKSSDSVPYTGLRVKTDGYLEGVMGNNASGSGASSIAKASLIAGVRPFVFKRASGKISVKDLASQVSSTPADAPADPVTGNNIVTLGALGRNAVSYQYAGNLYYVAVWNRSLTVPEGLRIYRYLKGLLAQRGVTLA